MKTGVIIQVRMGSTRFPGKVLKPLPSDGKDVPRAMEWTMRACLATGFPVYVATSTNKEDDTIDAFVTEWACSHLSSPVILFRGDPIDVLDRLYQCAKLYGLTEIVRVTGDCPFVDPDVIRQVVELRRMENADYASNVDPPTWPDGLDCQVVTMRALEKSWREATDPTDRDTVLQYIVHRRHKFSVVNLSCPLPGLAMHRWVLDTEEDYAVLSRMAKALLADGNVGVPRLVDILAVSPGPIWPAGARNERYLAARTKELGMTGIPFLKSSDLLAVTKRVQPFGASTYSKSYVSWGCRAPLYLTHAQGSRVWDVDGNEMIDMTAALGTTILGHADPGVRFAIERQLDRGIAFPLAHDIEGKVADKIADRVMPGAGKVVFGKNGSDVTTAAVRVARVVTGRPVIMMHASGYHGWHDWALFNTPRGNGCYAGVGDDNPPWLAADRLLSTKNMVSLETAAVIVEPDKFSPSELGDLIETAHRHGTLVIFDEMVTAFRYPFSTFAACHWLKPDLVCLGKALGNGMPITALVGKPEIMDKFVSSDINSPYAFFSGTHFGETLSLAAANHVVNTMDSFNQGRICGMASRISEILQNVCLEHLGEKSLTFQKGNLPRLTFKDPIIAAKFRREMAMNGVLVYSLFLPTLAHSDADLAHVEDALRSSLKALSSGKARGGDDLGSSLIMRT